MFLVFLCLTTLAYAHQPTFHTHPCKVLYDSEGAINEAFDFESWRYATIRLTTDLVFPEVPPYNDWTYELEFCRKIVAYPGNGTDPNSIGWSYGRHYSFLYLNNPHPLNGLPAHQFSQIYSGGDIGQPCYPEERSSVVNVWCGDNCTGVPGATTAACVASTESAPFCICSVVQDNTRFNPFCHGLVINVLADTCPWPTIVPEEGDNTAGIVFAVFFGILGGLFLIGYVYNWKVKGKRGLDAIPGADTCCKGSSPSYPTDSAPATVVPGYSASANGYQTV
eukprot:TRINITY_DN241_c0_g1_i1.p1 TRINITY_DN241_c0_g1~~TRINITY_DN241_c0_g1_i1.p1  ORF type:complete len:279 (-),score=42.75 TRINITY_DN241_c0_g1_i1:86-922(-)